MHWLVLSIELDTAQTGTGMVDPALKFECTSAAHEGYLKLHLMFLSALIN